MLFVCGNGPLPRTTGAAGRFCAIALRCAVPFLGLIAAKPGFFVLGLNARLISRTDCNNFGPDCASRSQGHCVVVPQLIIPAPSCAGDIGIRIYVYERL